MHRLTEKSEWYCRNSYWSPANIGQQFPRTYLDAPLRNCKQLSDMCELRGNEGAALPLTVHIGTTSAQLIPRASSRRGGREKQYDCKDHLRIGEDIPVSGPMGPDHRSVTLCYLLAGRCLPTVRASVHFPIPAASSKAADRTLHFSEPVQVTTLSQRSELVYFKTCLRMNVRCRRGENSIQRKMNTAGFESNWRQGERC